MAGAYALGYTALGVAQLDGDGPYWFEELDPLDALFLGTVHPQRFQDRYAFANARTAWLQLLRGTEHWKGIQRFVTEAVAASEQTRCGRRWSASRRLSVDHPAWTTHSCLTSTPTSPQPMRPPDLERHTVQMLGAADISPAWIYTYQHTDGLLPSPDGGFTLDQGRREWEEAIARYLHLHPDTVIDHDAQTRKLQTALGILTLAIAAGNPAYGACLTQRLQVPFIACLSRGTSISIGPASVTSVLDRVPLREFPPSRPPGWCLA